MDDPLEIPEDDVGRIVAAISMFVLTLIHPHQESIAATWNLTARG